VLIFSDHVERDEETIKSLVVKAIECADISFDVITTGNWELSALIADSFESKAGKIFIAGDAAHTLPPTRGGYHCGVCPAKTST
jgi:2-polyprenyl-6-methoxyphenol hydroxylase-like FAD-dependent oxidoreductase